LAAARLTIEEAHGCLLGSGRLSNPEAGFSISQSRAFREGAVGVSPDQRFPVTARLRLEKSLSRQLVEAAELEVLEAGRKSVEEVQTIGVKLLALKQQREMRDRQMELAQKLATFASDRAKTGEISPLDAAQAVADSQRLQLDGRRLETEWLALLVSSRRISASARMIPCA